MSDAARADAFRWVDEKHPDWSAWNSHIWHLAETAWREYRSAEWYVKRLRAEGFTVEEGSGGMPTAFRSNFMRALSSSRMTTPSPCIIGMIDTRTSTSRPETLSLIRPS